MTEAAVLPDAIDTRVVLAFLAQAHSGDFTARMPLDWTGLAGKVADGLNELVVANQRFRDRAPPGQPGRRQAG